MRSYTEILHELQTILANKALEKGVVHSDYSDIFELLCESFAYRLSLLENDVFHTRENLFLETASGENLDKIAENIFNTKRLDGVKPTATVLFTKREDFGTAHIPKGTFLFSKSGKKALLLEEVLFSETEQEKESVVELDAFLERSKERMTILDQNYPFLESLSQKYDFANGKEAESDKALRLRSKESLKQNTAGSKASYKALLKKADSRIEDIVVLTPKPCEVDLVYYPGIDSAMEQRIKNVLNDEKNVPTSIKITATKARQRNYSIQAVLKGKESEKDLLSLDEAKTRAELKKLERIGRSVSLFQIKQALAQNIRLSDVLLTKPTSDLVAQEKEVFVLQNVEWSFASA